MTDFDLTPEQELENLDRIVHGTKPKKGLPLASPDSYIRVPGRKPAKIGEVLEWSGVDLRSHGGDWSIIIPTDKGLWEIRMTEDLYEICLYSLALTRFNKFTKERKRRNG